MRQGRPTLGDVARVAGVHKATASRAMNPATAGRVHPDTAARVRQAAADLGYRPSVYAQGLRTQRTHTVGVLVPDIVNPLYPPFARGIDEVFDAHGYLTLVVNTELDPDREAAALDTMLSRQVDGLIAGVSAEGQIICADIATGRGVPVVVLSPPQSPPGVSTVDIDATPGLDEAVGLLAGLGHRRFGHIAAPGFYDDGPRRTRALRECLARRGLAGPDTADLAVAESASNSAEGGHQAATALFAARPEVTAVLAYNDTLALGTLRAAAEAGLRCPDDVSIVGFNDIPLVGAITPALTTVRNDSRAHGAVAAEILLAMLKGEAARSHLMTTVLVERGSHGPVRDA